MINKAIHKSDGMQLLRDLQKAKFQLIKERRILDKKDDHKYPITNIPFDIPDNWVWCFLSDVSIIQEGPGIRKHQYVNEGVQFLTVTNILEGNVDLDKSKKYISIKEYKQIYKHFTINKGDIVTACSGGSWGKSAIYDIDETIILNTSTLRLRFFDDLGLNKYLYYLTKSDYFKDHLSSHSTGQQPNFGYAHYSTIPIPLPSAKEQGKIIAILDEAFAAIDKAKQNAEKNLQNAKELFQSYQQQLFSQVNWDIKRLPDISQNLDSQRIPITQNKRKKGKVPYYGASGIVDYVEGYLFDEPLLLVSEDGANLLMRTYPIAFSVTGKTWVNNHAHVLKFKDETSRQFVEYYLNSIKLDDFVSGMAQPKLNQGMLNTIPIPFPDASVQKAVVRQLNDLTASIEGLNSINTKKLDSLEELKKSLLQKAFTGELTSKQILELL